MIKTPEMIQGEVSSGTDTNHYTFVKSYILIIDTMYIYLKNLDICQKEFGI
jgi:hypothetical protein